MAVASGLVPQRVYGFAVPSVLFAGQFPAFGADGKGIGTAAAGNYVALFQIGSLAGSLSASFLFARIRHRQWFNLGLS